MSFWLLFALGCSSSREVSENKGQASDKDAAVAGGSSLFDIIDRKRRETREKGRAEKVDLRAGASDLPPGWKEVIDDGWKAFCARSEDWPRKRAAWLALGSEAEKILVENLIRYYVIAWDYGSEREVRRTELELLRSPDLASTYLVAALASGYGDDVVRNIAGELLARLGAVAVPKIGEAYPGSDPRARRSLARSLKKMREPASVPLLIEIAKGNDAWETRIEAIQGLGDLGAREAVPAFLVCLRDDDSSVRKFAARSIAMVGDSSTQVIEGLISCMEKSLQDAHLATVRRCNDSLRKLTGQTFRADPRVWRAWLERRERRG
jgi:hypothetical protein